MRKKAYTSKEEYRCPAPEKLTPMDKKSIGIRQRDRYLCQACLHLYKGTERQYEYTGIEVHHITPLEEDISKAFEDDELVSLCRVHHEMAEADEIPRELLRKWAKESEVHFSGEERIVKKEAKV